jgi:hypothetical protein
MLKLSSLFDSLRFTLLYLFCHFKFLTMINTIVGAGAALRYGSGSGSGSDQMMRLLAAPAPQHWSRRMPTQSLTTCVWGWGIVPCYNHDTLFLILHNAFTLRQDDTAKNDDIYGSNMCNLAPIISLKNLCLS